MREAEHMQLLLLEADQPRSQQRVDIRRRRQLGAEPQRLRGDAPPELDRELEPPRPWPVQRRLGLELAHVRRAQLADPADAAEQLPRLGGRDLEQLANQLPIRPQLKGSHRARQQSTTQATVAASRVRALAIAPVRGSDEMSESPSGAGQLVNVR